MMGWPSVPFGDLYLEPSRNGLTRPRAVRGSGFKMVNMGELFAHPRIDNPDMELIPMSDGELESYSLVPGDLLFARQSLKLEGAGKCSIIVSAPESTTFESHIIRVRLNHEKADPFYYFYYFRSPQGFWNVQSLVMQVAAAGIRGSELTRLSVPFPPIEIQRRIAAILSAYDDLIENNARRIAILEAMARALYQEWFVHFRFPGHEHVPLINSPLGPIPEGWEVSKLSEVAEIVMGQSPKSEFYNEKGNGLPFHQGVTDFGAHFPTDRVFCTALNRLAEAGDVLLSVRAPVGRINVANSRTVIGRGLSAIRSGRGTPNFLLFQLKQHFLKEDTMGSGTIFKAVTKADLHGLELVIPTQDLVHRFEEFAKPAWTLLWNTTVKNSNLRTTRDLLLPKLISGEIDVSALPVEPVAEAAD